MTSKFKENELLELLVVHMEEKSVDKHKVGLNVYILFHYKSIISILIGTMVDKGESLTVHIKTVKDFFV